MEEIKIAFIGSRNYKHLERVDQKIDFYAHIQHQHNQWDDDVKIIIIAGGATGVDKRAIARAKEMGLATNDKDYTPNFSDGYDVGKYFERNDRLVDDAKKVEAFWDGKSRGTYYGIDRCMRTRKRYEVTFDDP